MSSFLSSCAFPHLIAVVREGNRPKNNSLMNSYTFSLTVKLCEMCEFVVHNPDNDRLFLSLTARIGIRIGVSEFIL